MLIRTATSCLQSENGSRKQPISANQCLFGSLQLSGATMPFARGAEIYGEDEPAEYVYKVVSGSVRTYKMLSDGRRQITAFYLPGDVFGLEANEDHAFSAEAVTNSMILVVARSAVTSLAARDASVARQLWSLTASELQKMQDHVLLLIKSARERVASFLVQMAARMPEAKEIDLPMSRQDIADYLGLTIETVSRMLTQLETHAAIALPSSRHIILRNRGQLDRLNS